MSSSRPAISTDRGHAQPKTPWRNNSSRMPARLIPLPGRARRSGGLRVEMERVIPDQEILAVFLVESGGLVARPVC